VLVCLAGYTHPMVFSCTRRRSASRSPKCRSPGERLGAGPNAGDVYPWWRAYCL